MAERRDLFQDRREPRKVAELQREGLASVIALAVIACLVLVGISYMSDTPPQTEQPPPRPPASYLAK
jgi:hypothetical protein